MVNANEIRKFQPAIDTFKNDHCTSSHLTIGAVKIDSKNNSGLSELITLFPEQLIGPCQILYSIPTW